MKYLITFILGLLPFSLCAEVYKCIDEKSKIIFSDMPCRKDHKTEFAQGNRVDDLRLRLESQMPDGTRLINVSQSGENVLIEYAFRHHTQNSDVMRMVNRISGKNTSLLKLDTPKDGGNGLAKILVSDKSAAIFKTKIKNKTGS